MTLLEKISTDFKEAFKARQEPRLTVLKNLQAELRNMEIEKRAKEGKEATLNDDETMNAILKEVKKRTDAKALYTQAGRSELVESESAEEAVLRAYLPEALSEEEVKTMAKEAVTRLQASSIKDVGKVMADLTPKTKGRADGSVVSRIVKEIIG